MVCEWLALKGQQRRTAFKGGARVTRVVAEEFETKGISLGSHVTTATMRIVDVFEGWFAHTNV